MPPSRWHAMHSRKTSGAMCCDQVTVPTTPPPPPVALPPVELDLPPPPPEAAPPEPELTPPLPAPFPSSSSDEHATHSGNSSPHTTAHRRFMCRHLTSFARGRDWARNSPSISRFLRASTARRRATPMR